SSYFNENKRPFHNIGNRIVRDSINILFKSNIKDIMTGYRAFSYQFVKTFPVLSKNFEIETEMSIHSLDKNLHIETVIVDYKDRPEGSVSKLNTFSDGFKVLKTIFNLFKNYKPFIFFSMISFILFITSTVFLIPVFTDYFKTGLVERFPTLFMGLFIQLASLMSFITALILDNMASSERRQFEINYINALYRFKSETMKYSSDLKLKEDKV
ncbi:MAG: glycosyl transferase, partial [Bacilli bacterium]